MTLPLNGIEPETQKPTDRKRFFRACAIGGALGLAAFWLAIYLNHGQFFAGSFASGFYETQARALRHLRFDVPRGSLGIEAFEIGSKSYMYFGPWPSIIRMPLMWLFPGMSGRWINPSMMVALLIALVASSRIAWKIRNLVNIDSPITRIECWVIGIFSFAIGGGSVFLFLTSQAWVYHEAEIWGAAGALIAFDAIFSFVLKPQASRLALASAFATMAVLSRPSVGFGPIFIIGILGPASLLPFTRRVFGLEKLFDRTRPLRWAIRSTTAAVIPAAVYIYVNYAKFGTWLVFPSDKQIFSRVSVYRKAMLADNGNTLFGFKFSPTAFVQYIRPDALKFSSLTPFIDFPTTAHVFGRVQFDTIEPTSSLTSSMPLFACLAIVGIFAAMWPGKGSPSRFAPTRLLFLGGLVGASTVIPYSYIAQRYMSDFMPLLIIGALVGVFVGLRWAEQRRWRRKFFFISVALLAALSSFVNTSLSWNYHNASALLPEGQITSYVDIRYAFHDAFPGGKPPYVVRGKHLPFPPLAKGTLFVVGDCEGVYYSQGNTWEPTDKWYAVARTKASGEYRFRVRFDAVSKVSIQPIVSLGRLGQVQSVVARVLPNNRVVFGFRSEGREDLAHGPRSEGGFFWGAVLKYKPNKRYNMTIIMDQNNGAVSGTLAGYVGLAFQQFELTTPQSAGYLFRTNEIVVGVNKYGGAGNSEYHRAILPKFLGTLRERRIKYPEICKRLNVKSATLNSRLGG